jgi:polysaccharide deacetylase family protein (PEP-CTERM system associated)
MLNALTIDLEDWYQGLTSTGAQIDRWDTFEDRVIENSERLLDVFNQAKIKATFFVLGYVADQFPELIRKIAAAGHEIGLHSYFHQRIIHLTPDQFRADVQRGRDVVEKVSGSKVIGYRAPMFSIDQSRIWALEILYEMGFLYDSSIFPIKNAYYGFPGAPRFPYHPFDDQDFVEFPLSTVKFLGVNWPAAGGFYLRLLPYYLFKLGLNRINSEGKPAIIYLHPWDLDPGQPYPNPTLRERFTHYYNLHTAESKLINLLRDFRFGPLRDLLNDSTLVQGG